MLFVHGLDPTSRPHACLVGRMEEPSSVTGAVTITCLQVPWEGEGGGAARDFFGISSMISARLASAGSAKQELLPFLFL